MVKILIVGNINVSNYIVPYEDCWIGAGRWKQNEMDGRERRDDRKLALTFDRGSWQVFREFARQVVWALL